MAKLLSLPAHLIRDALLYAVLAALAVVAAANALARGRLWLLATRERATEPPRPRTHTQHDVSAAGATAAAAAPAPADTPAPAPAPPRTPRRGPWKSEEITAGLLIGCKLAEQRNAILSQRVLRTLAREEPRIPSWSVVDRAARRNGQTGGDWLREARRRHRYDGRLRAVPDPVVTVTELRASG